MNYLLKKIEEFMMMKKCQSCMEIIPEYMKLPLFFKYFSIIIKSAAAKNSRPSVKNQ